MKTERHKPIHTHTHAHIHTHKYPHMHTHTHTLSHTHTHTNICACTCTHTPTLFITHTLARMHTQYTLKLAVTQSRVCSHTATHCNTLQHTLVQHIYTCVRRTHIQLIVHVYIYNWVSYTQTLMYTNTHTAHTRSGANDTRWRKHPSPILHCVAVCCRVLQCVAVCCSVLRVLHLSHWKWRYEVATISRLLKIIGLFCKRAL